MNVFHVFGKGKLLIKEKCLVLEKYENNRKISQKIPIENVDIIFCNGLIGLSPLSVHKILSRRITTFFLNNYGSVKGALLPIDKIFSTFQLKQYEAFKNRRIEIAKEIVNSIKISSMFALSHIKEYEYVKELGELEIEANDIRELMGVESKIWRIIYSFLKGLEINFEERVYNPPKGELNSIISYGNSLLYSYVLVELLEHEFNPLIGFLHELSDRRNSLALDLSESLKPLLIILLNSEIVKRKILNENHFEDNKEYTYLNLLGKVIYSSYFENFMRMKFIKLLDGRKVSPIWILRKEVENLKKSLENNIRFDSVWRRVCL
jgi:CRISPR-associated protein Cas1